MHDLILRNGTIVDGTGRERFGGDVAVDGGQITEVGPVDGAGRREIDASGLLVTPGWIDLHTHYDGQASWDPMMAPSSGHGVTSVVMGNCGVGFAPAAPDKHDFLINLMEGVEDIPGTALTEGLSWLWESFPQYMDALDSFPHKLDFGVQVPHAALRTYVMGERGGDHTIEPDDDEARRMSVLTREALIAGAIGFASSRVSSHRSRTGESIGTLTATDRELLTIGQALRDTGLGVMQFAFSFSNLDYELGLLRSLAAGTGRPLSLTVVQTAGNPNGWRDILAFFERAAADGIDLKAQVCLRPVGVLMGLEASLHPFMLTPTFRSIAARPLAERVALMRTAAVRTAILAEHAAVQGGDVGLYAAHSVEQLFRLGDPPNYEPEASERLVLEAERKGVPPAAYIYDLLLGNDGRELLYCPRANYEDYVLDAQREMALSDRALLGLSDAGAHVGTICDASFPTYNLQYWCRDRVRGERLELEWMVRQQTLANARHIGWLDRGVIAPGYKADINVIDFDRLSLGRPYIAHDLPAGGKRFLQEAHGYRFTICSGEVTFEDGAPTTALPGRLVRGPQPHRRN